MLNTEQIDRKVCAFLKVAHPYEIKLDHNCRRSENAQKWMKMHKLQHKYNEMPEISFSSLIQNMATIFRFLGFVLFGFVFALVLHFTDTNN